MKHLLIGAAAIMALVGVAASGSAQTQDDKGKGPAAESKSPGPSTAPEATDKAEPRKGTEGPGKDQPKSTQQKGDQQQRQSQDQPQGPEKDRKATEQRQPGQGEPKATEKRDPGKDQPKSTEQRRPEKDQPKSTGQQREPSKDQPRSTEQRDPAKEPQKSTQGQIDQKQANRVQVTEEKRSGVRDRLIKERNVQRTKINVSISIGTTLPRSVRLHRLPTTVVSFEPAYRGYSYVLLEDETIVIVDERTYVIVDVISVGSQRADRPGRTQLSLSPDQMRLIYSRVPRDRSANVRVRLALGAEVPRDVELLEFPGEVVDQVPDVRRYRYLVTGNDVIIVDPNDYAVALVINE